MFVTFVDNVSHLRHKSFSELWQPHIFCDRYTPVQLPRADIKPYHESYFADNPSSSISQSHSNSSTVQSSQSTSANGEIVPLEGLAATLHARMLNNQNSNNSSKTEHSSSSRDRRYDYILLAQNQVVDKYFIFIISILL